MAWSTLRKATDTDRAAYEAAAERFAQRHGIDRDGWDTWVTAVECHLDALTHRDGKPLAHNSGVYLGRLWKRCVNRALGTKGCDGIAYGHVGSHVD